MHPGRLEVGRVICGLRFARAARAVPHRPLDSGTLFAADATSGAGCTVIQRPPKLIRSAADLEDHARKGRPLGIDAETHARLTWLFLRREATSAEFRGLLGQPLAERIEQVWSNGVAPKQDQAS